MRVKNITTYFIFVTSVYFLYFILLFLFPIVLVVSLNNGLAPLPPMGWSSWNTLRCTYNESDIKAMADILVSSGMASAGYVHLNLDDCWMATNRNNTGHLTYNPDMFPSGLNSLSSYVHNKGLKFGLYTSSGPYTCQGLPGSWLYEDIDALTFASYGADYLKLDCCYQFNVSDRAKAFEAMSKALLKTGRPIIYSCDSDELILLENNKEYPVQWAPQQCNLARIHWDIWDSWTSIVDILSAAANIAQYSGAGYWNDLDILTVGMGAQTITEYISHFSLWCIISSPLLAGNDLRLMTPEIVAILTNKEAIAINQDKLAIAANMIRRSIDGSYETWAKPIFNPNRTLEEQLKQIRQQNYYSREKRDIDTNRPNKYKKEKIYSLSQEDSKQWQQYPILSDLPQPDFHPFPYHAVVLLNRASRSQDLFLDFKDLFDNFLCPHPTPAPWVASIRDIWNGKELGIYTNNFTISQVPSHGSVFLTVQLREAENVEGHDLRRNTKTN